MKNVSPGLGPNSSAQMNAKGQNIALMAAVKHGDVWKTLGLRAQGARDYGRHAWRAAKKASDGLAAKVQGARGHEREALLAAKMAADQVKAAFAEVATHRSKNEDTTMRGRLLPRITTTTTTSTTTTTTTTGTTSTTGTTPARGPGNPPGTPDS